MTEWAKIKPEDFKKMYSAPVFTTNLADRTTFEEEEEYRDYKKCSPETWSNLRSRLNTGGTHTPEIKELRKTLIALTGIILTALGQKIRKSDNDRRFDHLHYRPEDACQIVLNSISKLDTNKGLLQNTVEEIKKVYGIK